MIGKNNQTQNCGRKIQFALLPESTYSLSYNSITERAFPMTLDQYAITAIRAVHTKEDTLACLQILLDKLNPDSEAGDCLLSACVALQDEIEEAARVEEAELLAPADDSWMRRQDEAVQAHGGLS